MSRCLGTISRGIRTPIIREGDDLVKIVADGLIEASEDAGFEFNDRDVAAVTEAVVARAQGNYATVDDIAADISDKFGDETVGVVFPILSRNRFAICLRGIARGAKKIVLQLSYPSDEVGNHLIPDDVMEQSGVNPWTDVLTLDEYREKFGVNLHPFTGMDYVEYYKDLIEEEGAQVEIIFANDPRAVLEYTKNALCCDIHTRGVSKKKLKDAGADKVYGLDDIMTKPVDGSGYNPEYGLLGSNKSTEDKVKLFPRDCQKFVDELSSELKTRTGKDIEAMIYGDGAFKDPVGKIWELADPVVSPAHTSGLLGTPNEVKLKYLADNQFAHLDGEELKEGIKQYIREKNDDLVGSMESQGTTPRRITDLLGSLCDLTSGSGDKGTPVVLVQGYFDNYAD